MDCVMGAGMVAVVITVFAIWLYLQGEAVLTKATTKGVNNAFIMTMTAYLEDWQLATGKNFDAQDDTTKKLILGEFLLPLYTRNKP